MAALLSYQPFKSCVEVQLSPGSSQYWLKRAVTPYRQRCRSADSPAHYSPVLVDNASSPSYASSSTIDAEIDTFNETQDSCVSEITTDARIVEMEQQEVQTVVDMELDETESIEIVRPWPKSQ